MPTVRRLHVKSLTSPGLIALAPDQARHARAALRLEVGDPVELFDDASNVASARIERCDEHAVELCVDAIRRAAVESREIIVVSAIPKGDRADWMIEKLSEVGVSRFIPLAAERSVVLPEGKNKRERWMRIATEAAKQSNRAGVMTIDALRSVDETMRDTNDSSRFVLTTELKDAAPLFDLMSRAVAKPRAISLFVGPEGGWTDREIALFQLNNLTAARLTTTILRVETAAVVAAAIVASVPSSRASDPA